MDGDKKFNIVWLTALGALILLVPVFWHPGCFQSPFLYSKELLIKYAASLFLALFLWKYNKFASIFFLLCYFRTFLVLSERSLWALSNLRDFFLFYLLMRLSIKPKHIKIPLYLFLIALIIPILMVWMQYFHIDFIGERTSLFHGSFHGKQFRMSGFFGNPHIMHCWLALCAPLVFLLPLKAALPSFGIIILTIIICNSRGPSLLTATISSTITFTLLHIKTNTRKTFLKIIAILCPLFILLCGQSFIDCMDVRRRILLSALPKILDHPILGNGFNSFSGLEVRLPGGTLELQAHNEPVQGYIEIGIISLILGPFIYYYYKKFKLIPNSKRAILQGIFFGFIIQIFYSFPFHLAHASFFFLTILALTDILIEKYRPLQN